MSECKISVVFMGTHGRAHKRHMRTKTWLVRRAAGHQLTRAAAGALFGELCGVMCLVRAYGVRAPPARLEAGVVHLSSHPACLGVGRRFPFVLAKTRWGGGGLETSEPAKRFHIVDSRRRHCQSDEASTLAVFNSAVITN